VSVDRNDPGADPTTTPSELRDPDGPDGDYHTSSLWRWRGPASLVAGGLFAVLGWMLVAGAIAQDSDEALANARPDELVGILDSLDAENDRLEQEKRRLAAEIDSLTSGSDAAALAQARSRKESLEVLAGTTRVRGPGVRIVIRDPEGAVDAAEILSTVQELRDAGAESIEVSERRVIVSTWFADPPDPATPAVLVSGDLRPSPYTILAIGDPDTLATAMEIPGGVADSVRTAGAAFELEQREVVDITSTVPLKTPEYAEPVDQG
jgi:uncharacterized protein YlxW (UPF0749 family)